MKIVKRREIVRDAPVRLDGHCDPDVVGSGNLSFYWTRDCFVTPLLAMTVDFKMGVKVSRKNTGQAYGDTKCENF
ncbi:MAG: hypothetical protein EHM64_04240 [Ignavibacteriae bacterium]|nr:MAG: hypothetical protein EHM64_04240 [Ignavibacteriota bacterium]